MHQITDELSVYWRASACPLISLIFVAPLLAIYELAVVWQPELPRSATEIWLRGGFHWLGIRGDLILPLSVCLWLLIAHYATRRPWYVRWNVLPAMFCEALLGGVCLIATLQFLAMVAAVLPVPNVVPALTITSAHANGSGPLLTSRLSFIGAGIYEELFFRAMMIGPVAWVIQRLGETRRMSLCAAAIVSSLLFALAHHRAFATPGESFRWFAFAFRFAAGGLFATLYVFRGFGIAAGAHVAYDVLVARCSAT